MKKRSAVIITKNNKILLMHRIKNGQEYFAVPGGQVEKGEEIKIAAIREIKEETDLDVEIGELFFNFVRNDTEEFFFLANKISGIEKLGGPELERNSSWNYYSLEWVSVNDILNINLYPQEIKKEILKSLDLIFKTDERNF